MPSENVPADPSQSQYDQRIPESLMKELHDANQRFHEARILLEQTMGMSEFRHQERIDQAAEQMRDAERAVEEISGKIQKALEQSSGKSS